MKNKNIKKQIVAVFDDKERKQQEDFLNSREFIKSKFGSKQRRRKQYLVEKEKKQKDQARQDKAEAKKERREAVEKYKKILEDREKILEEYEKTNEKKVTQHINTKSQKVKVTTTFLDL